jgi:hypothetical protein
VGQRRAARQGRRAFTSTATQHGGQETTLFSIITNLLHFGMVIVGLPYSFQGQMGVDEMKGGSPYGATTISHSDGSRQPSAVELDGARFQGKHVAEICGKRQLGLLQMLRYDAQGKPIMSSGTHSEPMQVVAPDTLGDAELRFACGDEGHRVANDLFAVGVDEVAFAEALIARGNKPKDARAVHDALAGVAEPTVVATISEPDEHPADPVRAPEPAAVTAEDAPSHVADDARLIAQLEESCGKDDLADCRRLAKHLAEGDDVARPRRVALPQGLHRRRCG